MLEFQVLPEDGCQPDLWLSVKSGHRGSVESTRFSVSLGAPSASGRNRVKYPLIEDFCQELYYDESPGRGSLISLLFL